MKRAFIHYFFAVILLTIYGGQVCPFLENISGPTLGGVVLGWFTCGFLIRICCVGKIKDFESELFQVRNLFFVDLAIFTVVGFLLAGFNYLYFEFPLPSGLKLTLGCIVLGIFVASDLALIRERESDETEQHEQPFQWKIPNYSPLTRKLACLGSSLTVLTAAILILVLNHDF